MKNTNIRALAESAVLVALAFVLSYIKYEMPQGGSVTVVSMLPILLIGIRWGPVWGIGSGIVYAGLQMMQAFYPPPTESMMYYVLVVALDYVVAFAVLGLSFVFRRIKNGLLIAVPVCIALRFVCHLLSGVIIWGVYAWEGWSVWPYSFVYNGSYMGVELVITLIAAFALVKAAPQLTRPQNSLAS